MTDHRPRPMSSYELAEDAIRRARRPGRWPDGCEPVPWPGWQRARYKLRTRGRKGGKP